MFASTPLTYDIEVFATGSRTFPTSYPYEYCVLYSSPESECVGLLRTPPPCSQSEDAHIRCVSEAFLAHTHRELFFAPNGKKDPTLSSSPIRKMDKAYFSHRR